MGDRIEVKINAALVGELRARAVAEGLPDVDTIPDEELLAALIRAELEREPGDAGAVIGVTPPEKVVWVTHESGLDLRSEPLVGDVLKLLLYREKLAVQSQHEDWLQVRTADDVVGWIPFAFVTDSDPLPPLPPRGNVRAIHGSAGAAAPPRYLWHAWISELKAMGIAWYKQLDSGDPNDIGGQSTFAWVLQLKQNGIEPIIRYYQGHMFPGRLNSQAFQKMERYAAQGVVWCEIGNEPNLDVAEWHTNHHGRLSWQDPFYPRIIIENWMRDAERAVAAGARPGFYALAPTDWGPDRPHPRLSSVMFYRRMFEHVAADPSLQQRFRRLFETDKAWLAVHLATYEKSFDFDPFQSREPPYDMCLRGYEIPLRYLRELLLGDTPVIVMSTEGGVFTKDSRYKNGCI